MNIFKTTKVGKTTSVIVGLATAAWLSIGSLAMPLTAGAATIDDLLAQIAQLQAQLIALQGSSSSVSTSAKCSFTRSLTVGSRGEDVTCLQNYLKSGNYFSVNATGYFGSITKSAAAAWQAANGVSPAVGFFGPISRAKYDSLMAVTPTTPATPTTPTTTTTVPGCTSTVGFSPTTGQSCATGATTTTVPTGTGLTITSPTQPLNSLAIQGITGTSVGASGVPFTKITLTAGSADVVVSGVVVERIGPAVDAVFADVDLLDEDGSILSTAKTFGSDHRATIGGTFTVKAGTSKTVTVAGNMVTSATNYAGQVPSISVVSVNTSAVVTGSFPITGAAHSVNASLILGSVTNARGPLDPNTGQGTFNKEVGTTGYTFSSIKVTAGSVEDVIVKSIRWNQSGSASPSDIANVKTYVDGTAYDTTVSSDGKYYTSTFGAGIKISKGLSKEISIKADIVSGSGRTIAFDLYKTTDLKLTGDFYGYGITPSTSGTGFASTNPWYDASVVTVTGGSVNSISKSNAVDAKNIAILKANEDLGAFEIEVKGEALSIGQMVFNLQADGDTVAHITNISLFNQNGEVVAGPVDGSNGATNSPYGTATFTSIKNFPVGKTTLYLRGMLSSDFAANDTVQASTTPSSQWTTVKGIDTGNTVSLSTFSSAITANLMTVKAGALAISVSSQPTSRTVIAGAKGFEFARYVLDAGQSGEDVKLSSFKALLALGSPITASQLTNCNLYDGASNVTNNTNVTLATGDNNFTFNDGGLTVLKGTSKSLSMKCDLAASATSGTVNWGLTDNSSTYTGATAISSGQTVVETMTPATGQTMTSATTGSYTVTNDSSLLYTTAQAGTSGVVLAKLRFTAGATEAVNLKQIALQLGNTASNTPADLVGEKVTLWNGSTQIGTAQFGGSNPDNATSTMLSPAPSIAAGDSVVITVKGDLSAHNVNDGTPGAFLAITYDGDNNGINGNYGTGADSQTTINGGTASDVTTNGLRIFRTVPVVAITSNGGTLAAGADLYKFTITNGNSRDVVFKQLSFSIATTSGAVSGFTLYGDGVAAKSATTDATGATGSQTLVIAFDAASQAKIVPANSSKTYVLRASTAVDASAVTETLNIALLADTSFPSLANLMGTVAALSASNIIWSPFSTTTPVADSATESNLDWTNGYGMSGFPSNASFPIQTWTRAN